LIFTQLLLTVVPQRASFCGVEFFCRNIQKMRRFVSGELFHYALGVSLLLVAASVCLYASPQYQRRGRSITCQPAKLVNGSPVLFQVPGSDRSQKISGTWLGHQLNFFRSASSWYTLAGVPVETRPGTYELKLTETLASGKTLELTRKIKIARANYAKITVRVAKQFTEPNPDQLRQIDADKAVKQKTFATETPGRLWQGPFIAPASAPVSGVFGTARVFNQEVQSRHLGLDYGVPAGTPVHAINRGTVILARQLYFEGGLVVIDHGQGLFSLYLHLSDFRVKEGDQVDTGQLIAMSGGSGRATGPHLHLAIRWQGVYLDPAQLLRLTIPSS
jgi:murein DD-endopeptidase MepM/ murein hydrolase activator NlpD